MSNYFRDMIFLGGYLEESSNPDSSTETLKAFEIEEYPKKYPSSALASNLQMILVVMMMASKPKTMQEAMEIANDLMDQKVRAYAERQVENKRKFDNNNQAQQPPKKSVAIAYTAGSGERKEYVGTLPLCNRCKLHHNGPCIIKCENCKKVGHMTRDCRNPAAAKNQRTLTCFECGNQGTTGVIA
ncbi:reverse transcriptase domain-containing protein [Tanacetum coccineum]